MVCSRSCSSYSESSLDVSSSEDASFIFTYSIEGSITFDVELNWSKSKDSSSSWYDGFGMGGATKLIELSERPNRVSYYFLKVSNGTV